MPETFLILAAGGVMLAAAISNPREVTLHWLRLAGIIALCGCGLAVYFYLRREPTGVTERYLRVQWGTLIATIIAILGQLAFVQVDFRRTQRVFAWLAFIIAVLAGCNLLHDIAVLRGPKLQAMIWQTLACAGVAAMTGLLLMDMLLGHAYLTASKMTIAPFRRLNLAVGGVLVVRAILAVGVTMVLHALQPVEMLWGIHGLLIGTRWLVGLLVPAVFLYMAHDCIKRRSTQSATGILYVAGVLVFIGEIVALQLVRATGLPF
jgi:hypothetical protein